MYAGNLQLNVELSYYATVDNGMTGQLVSWQAIQV
jgi:hypothetical protein